MCNIAGYTGNRRAAPILIDMLRREQGFDAGFYTGIATIDNGNLYYAKVVGDLDRLLAETDALDLPGTTGIIHSRTPSGGDREWGQPFVSGRVAMVANGSAGRFKGKTEEIGLTAMLEENGHKLASKVLGTYPGYTSYPDGSTVHGTDVHCHLCEEYIRRGMTPLSALMRCLHELPCEAVYVTVDAASPARLFVARYNAPMFWGRADNESFIATTPSALPERNWRGIELLPSNAGVELTPFSCRVESCVDPAVKVGRITAPLMAEAYRLIEKKFAEATEPLGYPDLYPLCRPLFAPDELPDAAAVAYQILDSLLRSNRVTTWQIAQPGMEPGLTAPKNLFKAV